MLLRWILAALGSAVLSSGPVSADDIEDLFAERGPVATTVRENVGPGASFTLFEPAVPGEGGERHAVITWGNGTLSQPFDYFGLLDHLASYGFIVIASNSRFTGSGQQMIEGVEWVIEQNDDPDSPLFDTVDTEAIGATGHSQGGGGAINAGTDPRVVCTAPIQPIPGDVEHLQGPTFVMGGGQDFIVPVDGIAEDIVIPSPVATIFGILRDGTHFDPLDDADGYRGYVTAWFSGCLDGNPLAIQAFVAPCTLCDNPEWNTFRKLAQ
jgi:pimeloyl-ACP methyl ester carboxylesterase